MIKIFNKQVILCDTCPTVHHREWEMDEEKEDDDLLPPGWAAVGTESGGERHHCPVCLIAGFHSSGAVRINARAGE